jgi:hypothetical protein
VESSKLAGLVVDDARAEFVGNWPTSAAAGKWIDAGYRHDENTDQGKKSAVFRAELTKAGRYEVRLAYSPSGNRATNAQVRIRHAEGEAEARVDQRQPPPIDDLFLSLGTFRFTQESPAVVLLSNAGADGYVIADAVQFVPVEP